MAEAKGYYEEWKEVAKELVKKQRTEVDELINHFGGRPYGAAHLSPQQQAEEFAVVADDIEWQSEWVQRTWEMRGLSPGFISRAFVEENMEREAKRRGKTAETTPAAPVTQEEADVDY